MDERFFLIFPDDFVILAVGRSLSGYELKVHNLLYMSMHMYIHIIIIHVSTKTQSTVHVSTYKAQPIVYMYMYVVDYKYI